MDLIVGATGYVGTLLTQALVDEGRAVRALSRHPVPVESSGSVETVRGDVLADEGLDGALEGCDVAYYLVHSMEPGISSFEDRERRSANNFVAACRRAGVERVVYLGAIEPSGPLSPHMRSRLEVERVLLARIHDGDEIRRRNVRRNCSPPRVPPRPNLGDGPIRP